MESNRSVRWMHASFAALSIGLFAAVAVPPATAVPFAPTASDGEEKNWYDQLCQYLCFIGSRYGFTCNFIDGTAPDLANLVHELEVAFVAHGPIGNPPQSHYLDIIEALEILDAHYDDVGEPTNRDLDLLLTEIYFAEGGDPAFLP